ncbi:MAG: PD40 domain-containing protein [Anaerolineales bacterium]|nr:PD40 domain-containing protein [Anaerolineales bacterium]
MKTYFRTNIVIALCLLIIACRQVSQVTPSAVQPTETKTPFPTTTSIPSATATVLSTPRPYVFPTLIPTIDPAILPELLGNTFSVQALDVNGYSTQRITGWEHGFGTSIWYNYCPKYIWLDENHILLYPGAGQEPGPEGIWGFTNVVPQPVVLNLKSRTMWLPSVNTSSGSTCNDVYWSPELNILIVSGTYKNEPAVFTYSVDGTKISIYQGKLGGVSPRKTKLLLDNNIIVDLLTNTKIDLNWDLEDYNEPILSRPFWTSDETRIYRCCYFYADLVKGTSHRFQRSDFQDANGNHLDDGGLWFHQGEWVQDNTHFLVHWLAVDDGPVRDQPLFDPATKLFYDLWEEAGISPDLTWRYNKVSPDKSHVWIIGFEESYLVNLTTFEKQHFTHSNPYSYIDMEWSTDSRFTWFEIYDSDTKSTEAKIFSITDMELHPLPIAPPNEAEFLWHPNENLIVYPARDKNALIFWNAKTMSSRELSFKDQDSQYKITNLAWNPDGDKLIFITENHILWQIDYPALENLEQIIASAGTISSALWSPDGKSIAFVSDSDIYIVDTTK